MVNVIKNFSENNEVNSEITSSEIDDLVISVKSNVCDVTLSVCNNGGGGRSGSCGGCRCKIYEE